ncbi:MAG: bifunctional methionine sulfoxide reductase B/A protein [Thiotrichales bacterium]
MADWRETLQRLPAGLSIGRCGGRKYLISKEVFVAGRVSKVFARELGGTDVVSLNYYLGNGKDWLKPCEMSPEKVTGFLAHLSLSNRGVVAMLTWNDVIRFADDGNPAPDRVVTKTEAEWRAQLTEHQYYVTRQKGTERAFSSGMCNLFEPGRYRCVGCGTLLFDANEKFDSGTGWPSFTQPVSANAIAYHADRSHGMTRVETTCNTCQAHLGHVFPDGPAPSGLRYCINALALQKVESAVATATFGGGCFWCTEAIFRELDGVHSVASGYSGGAVDNPAYRQVCNGTTGHAEVIQVKFDPNVIGYRDLLEIHLATHDPTTLNRQGADQGTQYRSVIFAHDDEQRRLAQEVLKTVQTEYTDPVVTEIADFEKFYPAEDYHQDYFNLNPDAGYCQMVISPKMRKFREKFKAKLAG